jgi:predicted ester cyclase
VSSADNAARYRAAIDRFNAGDLDGYLALYSDDVVFGGVTAEPMDKAGVVAFHEGFVAAFPDAQVEVTRLVADGDQLASRLEFDLVHQGEFLGVPATGAPARFVVTSISTWRDGQIIERWSTADMYGLMVQLGAVPAPAG